MRHCSCVTRCRHLGDAPQKLQQDAVAPFRPSPHIILCIHTCFRAPHCARLADLERPHRCGRRRGRLAQARAARLARVRGELLPVPRTSGAPPTRLHLSPAAGPRTPRRTRGQRAGTTKHRRTPEYITALLEPRTSALGRFDLFRRARLAPPTAPPSSPKTRLNPHFPCFPKRRAMRLRRARASAPRLATRFRIPRPHPLASARSSRPAALPDFRRAGASRASPGPRASAPVKSPPPSSQPLSPRAHPSLCPGPARPPACGPHPETSSARIQHCLHGATGAARPSYVGAL